jgi:hypothetical protein
MHHAVIRVARRLLVGTATTVLLTACQNETARLPGSVPLPAVLNGTSATPAVPDAAAALAAQDAKAKAGQDATGVQNQPTPASTMSKEEESRTMPQPGQANDHSTLAPNKSAAKKTP